MQSFNERKYKRCIIHLITVKYTIVLVLIILFFFFGAGAGIGVMYTFKIEGQEMMCAGIGAGVGALIGLILGFSSTWGIEMKIQEAYWRIDMLNEVQKQNQNLNNKNIPYAKTVVAIENNLADPKDVTKIFTK